MIVGVVVVVSVIALTSSEPKGNPPHPSDVSQNASNSGPSSTGDAAASELEAAYNTMNNAVNADIPKQNAVSTDPTGAAAAINNEIAARKTFDDAVSAIIFPSSANADAQKVLSTDAALEQVLGTLAANTDDVANYNSVFNTVTPAENDFASAASTLANDLGLTIGNSGSSGSGNSGNT